MAASIAVFGGDAELDAATLTDCRFLNGLDVTAVFQHVVILCLRALYQPSTFDLAAETGSIAETHSIKPKPLSGGIRSLLLVLRGAVKHSATAAALHDDLVKLGFDEPHAKCAAALWDTHAARIAAYTRTASAPHAGDALVDLDWRFGVTVSTDDVARVGSTYVQLKLTVARDGALVNEHVELHLSQFYDLLAKLERAKSYVDYLSGVTTVGGTA